MSLAEKLVVIGLLTYSAYILLCAAGVLHLWWTEVRKRR